MNLNIKSFEEFKAIYKSEEFQNILEEAKKIKKRNQKFVIITLIWGIPAILSMLVSPIIGIIVMIIGILVDYQFFRKR